MCSVCFRYILANLFCAFLVSGNLLVGFFLLHLEAVFTSERFSLTADVSHDTRFSSALLVCISLLLLGVHCQNSHIRHSEYVFLSSVVHRICFRKHY